MPYLSKSGFLSIQEHCSEEIEEVDGQLEQLMQDQGRLRWAGRRGKGGGAREGGLDSRVGDRKAEIWGGVVMGRGGG